VRRLLALLLVALAGCGGEEPNADLLIRADRLFDGERFVEPGAVLIRGDRIVAAGTEVSGGGERTIDLGDATILPGFVDLHVHVSGPQVLRRGVTTARNLGSSLEFLDVPRPSPQRRFARARSSPRPAATRSRCSEQRSRWRSVGRHKLGRPFATWPAAAPT
jgi:hypothetical protein